MIWIKRLARIALIAVGCTSVYLLLKILRVGGTITYKEDNEFILYTEIVVISLAVIIGFVYLIKDMVKNMMRKK